MVVKYRSWVWVGGLSSIFFFLPSLALKLWRLVWESSWQVKSFIIYGVIGIFLVGFIRRRLIWKRDRLEMTNEAAPLLIVQRRLAEGKISLDEFRKIKQELQ